MAGQLDSLFKSVAKSVVATFGDSFDSTITYVKKGVSSYNVETGEQITIDTTYSDIKVPISFIRSEDDEGKEIREAKMYITPDLIGDNQIDFDVDGETAVTLISTSDSGSIAVSGSVKIQPQELVPAVSESRLYNKTSANGNVVDDLHFGTDGLTPAFAWVTLDDDGTSTSAETIFGVGSAITSTTHNMNVVHDTTTNGTRIHAEMDGIYKVTGNFILFHNTFNTVTLDIKVDGTAVHTTVPFVHSAVDPVERTMIYVGSIDSGSYVTATVDGTSNSQFIEGSVLLVERLK